MQYDILYDLLKNENAFDLYFYDNTFEQYFYIRTYSGNTPIEQVKQDVNNTWNKTTESKYIVKLKLNF